MVIQSPKIFSNGTILGKLFGWALVLCIFESHYATAVYATPCNDAAKGKYKGRLISCGSPDCDTRNTLFIISEVTGKKVVFIDTLDNFEDPPIRLVDQPWDMVLDAICHQNEWSWLDTGTVIEIRKQSAESCPFLAPGDSYSGRIITVSFPNTPLTEVLRVIAEVSNLNIVGTSSKVFDQTVSIQESNVPWDEFLDNLIKKHRFRAKRFGQILSLLPPTEASKSDFGIMSDNKAKQLSRPVE